MRPISKPEDDYTFYKEDRERIKSRSMLPTETLRYIEALEAIAKTAYEVWKNTPHANIPPAIAVENLNDLYDVLAVVDWMSEDAPNI